MRMYPLVIIPFLIEVFLNLHKRSVVFLKRTLLRLIFVYWPCIFLIFKPAEFTQLIPYLPKYFIYITQGNWNQILAPFTALGLMAFDPVTLKRMISRPNFVSIENYILYLFKGPLFPFTFITWLFAISVFKKAAPFIVRILVTTLSAYLAIFFIFDSLSKAHPQYYINTDFSQFKYTLLGIFIFVLSFFAFLEWGKGKMENNLLLAVWLGPTISLIFIFLTILFLPAVGFAPVDRYLVIASAGISLFVAGILTIFLEKIKSIETPLYKIILLLALALYLVFIFQASKAQIFDAYKPKVLGGRGGTDQNKIHNQISYYLDKYHYKVNEPSFFYFETPGDLKNGSFFYEALTGSNFIFWYHLEKRFLTEGCVGYIFNDKNKLIKILAVENGVTGFRYYGTCVLHSNDNIRDKISYHNTNNIFYTPENFYAFRLKDKEVFDIRNEILKELGLSIKQ